MNERIRELAEQADGVVINKMMTGTKQYTFLEKDLEKFAELIVRECARVYWNIDDGETHTEYVEALKEHFGVE